MFPPTLNVYWFLKFSAKFFPLVYLWWLYISKQTILDICSVVNITLKFVASFVQIEWDVSENISLA